MKILNHLLHLKTAATLDFIDITDQIQETIKKTKVKKGVVNVQSLHTTAAVVINEAEPLLLSDLKRVLERIASSKDDYSHDNFAIRTVNMCNGECQNGHSHCKAIFLPTSQLLNILNGKLQLGLWQRVFFVELDRSRSRKVALQIIGKE